ncbi:MAG: response regulator transcription factor [Micrococcales bacterium]|nr:response regulator transcription factor [Micrococcales bacterium]
MTSQRSATPATPVRVVLVDDHRMFRTGVRAELTDAMAGGDPVCEFVGEAPDVDSAIAVIRAETPDVVLLDVHLPGGSGNGGVGHRQGEEAHRRAGGYVTKTIGARDLVTAIRRVADGDAVFSPRLAGFVLDAFGAAAGEIAEVDEELDRLSAREREVMRLIARGYQYKEVAKELFISVKTVETHVSSVLRKLQLSSRHELTAWAMGRRLV